MGRTRGLSLLFLLGACATTTPPAPEGPPPQHRRIELPLTDDDGDRVANVADRCPDDPEDGDDFRDDDGCPEADNDGDGLRDEDDLCPTAAGDRDLVEDGDGCPDPDNDGDGVVDARDLCPNDAEVFNGVADEDGCPDAFHCTLGRRVAFEPIEHMGRVPDGESGFWSDVDADASRLLFRPDLELVVIEGHVSSGRPRDADARSLAIADAVRRRVVDLGFAPDRVVAVGLGARCPRVPPRGARAALNNRVQWSFARRAPEGRADVFVRCPRAQRLISLPTAAPVITPAVGPRSDGAERGTAHRGAHPHR